MNEKDVEEIVGERLDGISKSLEAISKQQQSLGCVVSRLDKAIRGNGKPGLNQEVAVMQEKVKSLEATDRRVIGVFGGVCVAIGGFLPNVLEWFSG